MKEIFLVAAHISDEIQLSFISELIGNLRKEKKEFAIVSHSPIPEFLTKESKFYVYDSDNYLIPKYKIHTEGYGHRNFYFWDFGNFKISSSNFLWGNTDNYGIACLKLLQRGTLMAKSFGYDILHFIEYDYNWKNEVSKQFYEILKKDSNTDLVCFWQKKDPINHLLGNFFSFRISSLEDRILFLQTEDLFDLIRSYDFCIERVTETFFQPEKIHRIEKENLGLENRISRDKFNKSLEMCFHQEGPENLDFFCYNVSPNFIKLKLTLDNVEQEIEINSQTWILKKIGNPEKIKIEYEEKIEEIDLSDKEMYDFWVGSTKIEWR